jgi:lipopolysaccharide heptosyltransferase I
MPRPPLHAHDARRIALIKPSALGDVVHALPVLTALRRRFPQAHLTWVVGSAYAPLLRGHPDLDEVLPFERRADWLRGARAHARFFLELRRRRFDLVVDLQGLLRSGLMAAATGAARRVGASTAREGARWFYTDVVAVPPLHRAHAVERYWRLAEALGAGGPKEFRVPILPEAERWAAQALADLPRPWLMLGPGARWPTKRWPAEHFAELARRARACCGGAVVLVGSADEAPLATALRRLLVGPVLDLVGRTTLPQLVALLARADVLLANDTGPLHLADALGRPVVAPYTCTRARLTGPYRSLHRVVETGVWCAGSYRKRCARLECHTELTPARLWPILDEVLRRWQRAPSRSA